MKNIIRIILALTWCLPQNILGFLCLFMFLVEFPCRLRDGAILIKMNWPGGITVGNFVFLCPEYWHSEYVIRHELGHVRQSYILGPLYLLVIGIPSLLWAALHHDLAPNKPYDWFYTEAWADRLSQ